MLMPRAYLKIKQEKLVTTHKCRSTYFVDPFTELAKKVSPRLRDSACWRSAEITQPRTHFFGQLCMSQWGLLRHSYINKAGSCRERARKAKLCDREDMRRYVVPLHFSHSHPIGMERNISCMISILMDATYHIWYELRWGENKTDSNLMRLTAKWCVDISSNQSLTSS